MSLTLQEIRKYRALVQRHPGNVSAKIITHLLDELKVAHDEITKLRIATADKHGEYDDYTPIPFGQHKGERLKDVPEDYLYWWWSKNSDRSAILFDMDFGKWPDRISAVKKLRLHDYLKVKYGNQVQTHIQSAADTQDNGLREV
jgi:hypothetical protein